MNIKNDSALLKVFGLHPITAAGVTAVDVMLFGSSIGTDIPEWLISIPIAIMLTATATLIQKNGYHDSWQLAFGKGIMLGIITVIPTPLPAIVTLAGGCLGFIRNLLAAEEKLLSNKNNSTEKEN